VYSILFLCYTYYLYYYNIKIKNIYKIYIL